MLIIPTFERLRQKNPEFNLGCSDPVSKKSKQAN
jgi:hypothetical protein